MGKDRDWGKLLLAAIPIHGLDDYVDNIKLALRDHGVPVFERSVDGGYDMDGLEEIRFGMGGRIGQGTARTTAVSEESWANMMERVRWKGQEAAQEVRDAGYEIDVGIMVALYGRGGDPETLAPVKMPLDWTLAKRREMVVLASMFLAAAKVCGIYDSSYPKLLAAMVEGAKIGLSDVPPAAQPG